MFKNHSAFETPSDDCKRWRYMSIDCFLQICRSRAIWFSRADLLDDRFEGSYPKGFRPIRDAYLDKRFSAKLVEDIKWMSEQYPKTFYVSCWAISKFEKDFMWKTYGNNEIAICTTIGRVKKALPIPIHNFRLYLIIDILRSIGYNFLTYLKNDLIGESCEKETD